MRCEVSAAKNIPIIDVRCRVTVREAGEYFSGRAKARGRFDTIKSFAKGTIEAFFEEIGEAGITTAVSTSGQTPEMKIGGRVMAARTTPNDLMGRLQKEHWGRFIGVAGIDCGNVLHNALDEIDRCARLGLRVVFIEPGRSPGCDIDDRRLYPLYEKMSRARHGALPADLGPWGGKSIDYAHPRHIDQVAEDFPGAPHHRGTRLLSVCARSDHRRGETRERLPLARHVSHADGIGRLGEVAQQQLFRAARPVPFCDVLPVDTDQAVRGRVLEAADQGRGPAEDPLQERAARLQARRRSRFQIDVPA